MIRAFILRTITFKVINFKCIREGEQKRKPRGRDRKRLGAGLVKFEHE